MRFMLSWFDQWYIMNYLEDIANFCGTHLNKFSILVRVRDCVLNLQVLASELQTEAGASCPTWNGELNPWTQVQLLTAHNLRAH